MAVSPGVGAGSLSRVTDALRRIIQMPVDVSTVPGEFRSLTGRSHSILPTGCCCSLGEERQRCGEHGSYPGPENCSLAWVFMSELVD